MIKIICIGRLKEKYLDEACSEYLKRLQKYTNIEIIEIPDEKIDEEKIALRNEKEKIKKILNPKDYLITLEIEGKELSSTELTTKLNQIQIENSNITFIIGGSYGLDQDIKNQSNFKLSFSKLTFPHQLFRVLLLEQLYRSYKILNNEKYHK